MPVEHRLCEVSRTNAQLQATHGVKTVIVRKKASDNLVHFPVMGNLQLDGPVVFLSFFFGVPEKGSHVL